MSTQAVKLSGPLDFHTVCSILQAFERPQGQAWKIDLGEVTHADTAGLALLLELKRRAMEAGADLQLVGAPAQFTELADFFGLRRVLPLG